MATAHEVAEHEDVSQALRMYQVYGMTSAQLVGVILRVAALIDHQKREELRIKNAPREPLRPT